MLSNIYFINYIIFYLFCGIPMNEVCFFLSYRYERNLEHGIPLARRLIIVFAHVATSKSTAGHNLLVPDNFPLGDREKQ